MPADLRTIRGVELIKTGRWEISTGTWEVTPELIAAAKAAHESGTIPRPIVKLGHVDERFDGEPALGIVGNLQITDDGHTLIGDLEGVPAWLADVVASAYPNRSVEGVHNLKLPDGTSHAFALTAVALLGVTRPGIPTLAGLQRVHELYGIAASAGTPVSITMTTPAVDPADALTPRQRVQIRAAGNRRRHRAATQIIAAITAEQEQP